MVTGIPPSSTASMALTTEKTTTRRAGQRKDSLQNQFMQLLVNQMRYQDPMSPMKDGEFLSQMVQLTTLEQLQALNTRLTCISLVGKHVVVVNEDGEMFTGTVEGAKLFGVPALKVAGRDVPLDAVLEVLESQGGDP